MGQFHSKMLGRVAALLDFKAYHATYARHVTPPSLPLPSPCTPSPPPVPGLCSPRLNRRAARSMSLVARGVIFVTGYGLEHSHLKHKAEEEQRAHWEKKLAAEQKH